MLRRILIWGGRIFLALLLVISVWLVDFYLDISRGLPDVSAQTSIWAGCPPPPAHLHEFTPLASMPPAFVQAYLANNDPGYLDRAPVSVFGELRKMVAGQTPHAGSGVSELYARQLLQCGGGGYSKNWRFRLALLTYRVERNVPKANVLEVLLNALQFGRGRYGAAAAAKAYFHRPINELSLAELAFLAGAEAKPSTYASLSGKSRIIADRNKILKRMAKLGHISKAQEEEAIQQQLTALPSAPSPAEIGGPASR